jgi:hypothetical protein
MPILPGYTRWYLMAIGDDDVETFLGSKWFPNDTPAHEVRSTLMEEYWDPRLDAASCTPRLVAQE